MFQFPTFAFLTEWLAFYQPGCPIRKSWDQRLFAPTRSLSQLITSFIVSVSLGIHHTPFLTFFRQHDNNVMKLLILSAVKWNRQSCDCDFKVWTLLLYSFACVNMSKIYLEYRYLIKSMFLVWRITDSNRWPPACKAGALASWANPPSYKWKTESGKWKIRRVPDFQFSIFNFQLWSSPRQSWTADLYIISVAL